MQLKNDHGSLTNQHLKNI